MKKFNIPRNFRPTLVILAIVILGISVYRTVYVNIDSKYYLASEEEDPSVTNLPAGKETKDSREFDFGKLSGRWNIMEFKSTKGNKIKIVDNSKIAKGKLYVVVLDSNYKSLAIHKSDGKSTLNLTTPKDGKYIIRIVGQKTSGHINMKVTSPQNIHLIHRGVFG